MQATQLNKKTYKKKLFNGLFMQVDAKDHIQKSIFWYGAYEKDVSRVWQQLVNRDSVILDIGANIGYFSLLAAAKAKDGKVFSFEPVSFFRDCLQQNMALNAIENYEALSFAISNKNEPTNFYLADGANLGMSGMRPPENFSGRQEQIQTIVLDEWVENKALTAIDFIKLDIEGAEKKALDGMNKTLSRFRPVLLIEIIHSQLEQFGNSVKEIYDTLTSHDYIAYEIVDQKTIKQLFKRKEGYDVLFLPKGYQLPPTLRNISE